VRASTRDYKRRQKPSLELWKMREFGMGALVGIILAGSATVFIMNARQHEAAAREKNEAPHPDPRRKAPTDPEATATAAAGEKYDFYEMLPKFEFVVPEKDKDVKSDLRQLRRLNALACMFCRLAHTATNLTPTACASSCPCRASTPKFSGSQWTLMSGIGSESARSPASISSMSCESSFRRADVDALVIHVGD